MFYIKIYRTLTNNELTCIHGGFIDIPDGGRFNDIPNHKLFDRLVLRYASRAVGAPHSLHVATAVLGASSITAFASLESKIGRSSGHMLELTTVTRAFQAHTKLQRHILQLLICITWLVIIMVFQTYLCGFCNIYFEKVYAPCF